MPPTLPLTTLLYYGLPNYLLKKIQNVTNRAARFVKGLPRRERITPALIDLHRLPVKARIVYKICPMTYEDLQFKKPKYINDLLSGFHLDTSMTLRHSVDRH